MEIRDDSQMDTARVVASVRKLAALMQGIFTLKSSWLEGTAT